MVIFVLITKTGGVIVLISAIHKRNAKRESITNVALVVIDLLLAAAAAVFHFAVSG